MKIVVILLGVIALALGCGVVGLYLGLIPVGKEPATTAVISEPTAEPTSEPTEEPMTPERMEEVIADTSRMAPLGPNRLEEYYKEKMQKNPDHSSGASAVTSIEGLGEEDFSAIDYADPKERYKAKKRVRNDINQKQWELEKEDFSRRDSEEKKLQRARAMEKWIKKHPDK